MIPVFLKKSFQVLSLLLFLVITLLFLSSYSINSRYTSGLDPEKNTLIVGHSHSACAYDNSYLDHSYNFSASGESYFYSLIKTKRILSKANNINRLFIEFTNNSYSEKMDNWVYGEKAMLKLPKYYPFLYFEDHIYLIGKNPIGYISTIPSVLKLNVQTILKGRVELSTRLGGFEKAKHSKLDSLLAVQKKVTIKGSKISSENLKYLKKIINYCADNEVSCSLLRSPIHWESNMYSQNEVFQRVRKDNFNEIPILDLAAFNLPNEAFADPGHLNPFGAKICTNLFLDSLNKL